MDPISQSLLGAAAVQSVMTRHLGRLAFLCGALGGELADSDVFLTPLADPAVSFHLHRHFTHALIFIPVGGALATAFFLPFKSCREKIGTIYAACTLGFATHGLLDNCTSYGTHLLWPFVGHRTAWDIISIIDPIFTIPLLLGTITALILKKAWPARVALAFALSYLLVGAVQHRRASHLQQEIAEARGHEIDSARVMPSFGNMLIWRSVYASDDTLHADAIRLAPFREPRVMIGRSVPVFTEDQLPTEGTDPERVLDVFRQHRAFATGFITRIEHPGASDEVYDLGDVRYSLELGGFAPIWGLRIVPDHPIDPVMTAEFMMGDSRALGRLWNELWEPSDDFVPWSQVEIERPDAEAPPHE